MSLAVNELLAQLAQHSTGDAKNEKQALDILSGIYEHSSWVVEEFVSKPSNFASISTITQLAISLKAIVDQSSREKKMVLLRAHPDLCEKTGKLEHLTKESQEEQGRSGLQSLTNDEFETFHLCNAKYREKFGFPFILAVRNATKYTVLAALQGRVHNPVEVEFVTALEQVHKIAWMRLLTKLDTTNAQGFLTCHVLDTANGCPGTETLQLSYAHGSILSYLYSLFYSICLIDLTSQRHAHSIASPITSRSQSGIDWRIYYQR